VPWLPDPDAIDTDAFLIQWKNWTIPFANPPPPESHLTSITEDNTGTSSSDNCNGSILAQCNLVPNITTVIIRETVDSSSASGTNNFAKSRISTNTIELDAIHVPIIRSKLVAANLSDQAIQGMLHQQLAPTPTDQGYRKKSTTLLSLGIKEQCLIYNIYGSRSR
jgi:hypothetical protein